MSLREIAKLVHGDERACAAIDQYVDLTAGEVQAGIKSSAGAEGVAAADELQSHIGEFPKTLRKRSRRRRYSASLRVVEP